MNALCRAYDTSTEAERAVQALLGGGVPGDDIRLLMGAEIHDARSESGGGFAGSVASDGHVGDFSGEGHPRATPRSSFAGRSSADSEGVFANADRDVVVSYSDGREHSRVAGHRQLKKLLVDAGLDEDAAESDVRALHDGRTLVLVTVGAVSEERAAELLDAAIA
jgi:hypothetical protein